MIKTEGLFTTDEMTKSTRSLHTPGNFARQNLLYVQEVGKLQSIKPHKCEREGLDSFLFLTVLKGRGVLKIQGKKLEVEEGDCAFIDCMEHYEHISDEKDAWELAWVHFNGHCARGYYEQFLRFNGGSHAFHVREQKVLLNTIEELMELQKDKAVMAELYCGEKLLHLLNCIMDAVAGTAIRESARDKQLAEEIRESINENYASAEVIGILQDAIGKTVEELEKVFQKSYGISVLEYIGNRRYNAAKEMLRFSVKPVEQVARESGIGDVIAMQEMFRTREGMSVEEYRKKWAGWIRH